MPLLDPADVVVLDRISLVEDRCDLLFTALGSGGMSYVNTRRRVLVPILNATRWPCRWRWTLSWRPRWTPSTGERWARLRTRGGP